MDLAAFELNENDLKYIADLVYENCGIVFKDSNLSVLISRISTKLKEKNLASYEYLKLLRTNKNELAAFIDFVTTNFTSFFRNPKQFEILKEDILPEVVKRNSASKIVKIWSAGCSTGEEAYSILMVVDDFFRESNLAAGGWRYQIVASDISLESLFFAKEGKYSEKNIEKIENQYIARCFDKLENSYLIRDEFKKLIRFDYHNLIYDNGIRDVDLTFCRNVLIYFDEEVQKKVLSNIQKSMKDKSFLLIGHSESLIGLFEGFKPSFTEKGIVYVRQ